MPLTKLQFQPGVNKEISSYGGEGGWRDANKVRFRFGLPEKIGGWRKHNSATISGIPRAIFAWRQLDGQTNIAYGTHSKLYIEQGGAFNDITPIRRTASLTDPFTTVSGSTTVTVTDSSHGATTGDYVTFTGASAVGGLAPTLLNLEFQVTVTSTSTYTITVASAATASTTGGGSVSAAYQINIGLEDSTYGLGWGTGAWGHSTWGTARSASVGVKTSTRTWSLSNWGEDLIATPLYGETYVWDASSGVNVRATEITQAPDAANITMVSSPDRHLVALGAHDGSSQDEMLVKWGDQEDYTDWTASATNTAGSQLLEGGSRIVAVVQSRGQILILTDTTLHSMQYIGPPYTFGFQVLGTSCGAISPNAVIDYNGTTFWMGTDAFYMYDGAIKTIPCTLLGHVFDNLSRVQGEKVFGFLNKAFDEITWFYATSDEPENYVTLNFVEQTWTHGTMSRTAWTDKGLLEYPLSSDSSGQSYDQEYGSDADGSAMTAYIESSDFDIAEGDQLMFVRRILPDFEISGGSVDLTFKTRKYPHSSQVTETAHTVSSSTELIHTRMRGRQSALRIESDATGDNWRYGATRFDMQPDGRR